MNDYRSPDRCGGFILMRPLVVIAIIAVFIGIPLSAIQKTCTIFNPMKCGDNIQNIGLAELNYAILSILFQALAATADDDIILGLAC